MPSTEYSLVEKLQQMRDKMPTEVRLVFDFEDNYDKIIGFAEGLADQPSDLLSTATEQAQWAEKLAGLAEQIDQMDKRVPDWQGPAREAFDDAMNQLGDRARDLADVGKESSTVLSTANQGWRAGDELVLELVGTSIDFAQHTLEVARRLAPLTSGISLSTWATINLRQVMTLTDEIKQATQRVGSLREHLTGLLTELTQASRQLTDDMAGLSERVKVSD